MVKFYKREDLNDIYVLAECVNIYFRLFPGVTDENTPFCSIENMNVNTILERLVYTGILPAKYVYPIEDWLSAFFLTDRLHDIAAVISRYVNADLSEYYKKNLMFAVILYQNSALLDIFFDYMYMLGISGEYRKEIWKGGYFSLDETIVKAINKLYGLN